MRLLRRSVIPSSRPHARTSAREGTMRQLVFTLVLAAMDFGGVSMATAQPTPNPVQAQARVRSPEAAADGRVTFLLSAPAAASVTLNGDWIGATDIAMTKGADGVWTTTVGPLKPELYGYWFMVDGVRA